jgi:malonyl-CoA O-methyltransferase
LSARLAGVNIDVAGVLAMATPGPGWIMEGAGGVLVPLNERELMIDLIVGLGVAALVATRSTLGTINHTLLTIAALRARSIPVAGVVMIGDPDRDNREAIETYGGVPVLGEMPRFVDLNAETLGEWSRAQLDRDSCLEAFLK